MAFFRLAAIMMGLFVILGAFGAHGLEKKLDPKMMKVYQTAVFYHAVHGLALFIVAFAFFKNPSKAVVGSGICFIIGIILFSGSLYALALSGITKLGIITPFGGLAFIIGWFTLATANLKA